MAGYFLDTSALGKHYHYEVGTPDVDLIFQQPGAALFISRLAVVELQSAFAKKVRMQQLAPADFSHLIALFQTDVARKILNVVRLKVAHFQEAERLIRQHSSTKSLRALDAIQLAVALDLSRQGQIGEFVCADRTLCEVAQLQGLPVINPAP